MAKHHRPVIKKPVPMLDEFKKFILRGNVMDLAVGVIIGGAFNKIVSSLVNDVIMPLFSIVIGQTNYSALFIALDGKSYASIEEAGSAPLLLYGNFLSTVLDFLLMGLVIFLLVKFLNFLHNKLTKDKDKDKEKPPEAPTVQTCPFCKSSIHIDATVCPQCTRDITPPSGSDTAVPNPTA